VAQTPASAHPRNIRVRWAAPLLVALIVYLVLSVWLAQTKAPWCDEGWFANPAYDLAFHGRMGTTVLEPSGFHLNSYFKGIQERTYLFPPNHLVALAGWFRIFGMSALTMRAYSICWGAATLPLLYYILLYLFPDRRVAQLGTLLTAIDFIYLWTTADGRPEASANALALASLAAYLHFRRQNFSKAVLISQILGASAVFVHPCTDG
jgi:4-amino-4-deoxy-L-arabinose transferase-like glycosyltransferase